MLKSVFGFSIFFLHCRFAKISDLVYNIMVYCQGIVQKLIEQYRVK